jgi:acid stress-induced BolA-like protein IbaG/YrbA
MCKPVNDCDIFAASALREAIEQRLPLASADVTGKGGHYRIEVTSPAFAGHGQLESHRLVYRAISHLMQGDTPAVHAITSLRTHTPQ